MKKKRVISFLLTATFMVTLLTGFTQSNPVTTKQADLFVEQLAKIVAEKWPHMQKIWPNLDYSQHNIVIFYLNSSEKPESTWLINTKGYKLLKPSEYKEIQIPIAGQIGNVKFLGKASIALSLSEKVLKEDSEAINYFKLLTHELVHFYNQTNIEFPKIDSISRAQEYPLSVNPRLYRRMLYQNLNKAMVEKNNDLTNEYIRQAAFWYRKWKNEYSAEVNRIRITDMREGHAKYIEYIASFINKSGKIDDVSTTPIPAKLSHTATWESYQLGIVAGILLDKMQPDWKEKFQIKKMSPTELLLENVPEKSEIADVKIEKDLTEHIRVINETIKASIENIITAEKDKKIPYLRINVNYQVGSMSSDGFYTYQGKDIIGNYTGLIKKELNALNINKVSVFTSVHDDVLCIIIPLTEAFIKEGNLITLKGSKINGSIEITESVDVDDRVWYIVK